MALDVKDRESFVRSWGTVLMKSWEDDAFKARLQASPAEVLAENGVALVDGAQVELDAPPADAGPDLEAQIAEYEKGAETGSYVFYVQETNQLRTQEIPEEELEGVAAGACCSSILSCCCC